MIYAIKIKMRPGSRTSQSLTEIDSIYLSGLPAPGFYPKENIHDFLKRSPGSIEVGISPYPTVIPATSINGEKYVKSTPNTLGHDNLLSLPRE